jgi:hypothetical protein
VLDLPCACSSVRARAARGARRAWTLLFRALLLDARSRSYLILHRLWFIIGEVSCRMKLILFLNYLSA